MKVIKKKMLMSLTNRNKSFCNSNGDGMYLRFLLSFTYQDIIILGHGI